MPLDYSDPRTIRFLKENYDKENEQRISWFVKNKEEIIKAAALTEKHKGYHTAHVARALVEPLIPALSLHHKVTKVNRLTKVPLENPVPLSPTKRERDNKEYFISGVDLLPESIMRPVDANVSKILYEEIPTGGRRLYLNLRNKLVPSERYYFCETSGNVYGWKLSGSEHVDETNRYKRYASINRDTTSRSGPQPDPKHYGQLIDHTKCNA